MTTLINLPKTITGFFGDVVAELKAMDWISLGDTVRYTLIVLILTALVVLVVFAMDSILVAARSLILNRF